MPLNILPLNDKNYKSDRLENGRIAKGFFKKIAANVFNQSYSYYKKRMDLTNQTEFPLIFRERNLYSTFSAAINKITPVHLSEWSFSRDESTDDKNRRVDFWCLYKNGPSAKPINYWIEIKKGWYCLNKNSRPEFNSQIVKDIRALQIQISSLKKINPQWDENANNIYIGMIVLHTYSIDGQEKYSITDIENEIDKLVDRRKVKNYLISSWQLPKELTIIEEESKYKYKSVSIVGFIVSKEII